MKEEWREISDYKGIYEVSNTGKVRSLNRVVIRHDGKVKNFKGKYLAMCLDKYGYQHVSLSRENKSTTHKVHRLVISAFIENKELKRTVNHIDGDKVNNNVANLEWATHSENTRHAVATGLISYKGKRNTRAKLTDTQVKYIRKSSKKQIELALEFNVDPKSIRQILNYTTYKEYL